MKKILAIVLCACMICALLAGCGSSESPAAAVEGDVLKIGIFEPATGENGDANKDMAYIKIMSDGAFKFVGTQKTDGTFTPAA